jgi:hypothetical protein
MRTCIAVLLSSLASAGSLRGEDKEKANADKEFLTKELPGTAASVKIIDLTYSKTAICVFGVCPWSS